MNGLALVVLPTHFILVVRENCPCCKKEIEKDSVVFALGSPFHCLVHGKCLPFFNFKGGWPHEKPLQGFTDT